MGSKDAQQAFLEVESWLFKLCVEHLIFHYTQLWHGTPLKFNMEPKNHPTEKENHLRNLHFQVPNVKFQGSSVHLPFFKEKKNVVSSFAPVLPDKLL